MNQVKVICFYCVLIACIFGCRDGVKTRFTNTDLKWMNVYDEGDSLFFKSEDGQYDTSIIVKKEIFYPQYNPTEVHGKYLPQWGAVWYRNKSLEFNPDGYRLITLEKKSPDETYLNLNYLYANIMVLNLNNNNIEKYKRDKVYEFDTYSSRAASEKPKKIFWHEEYGVIKYITHGNVMWERVNLKLTR